MAKGAYIGVQTEFVIGSSLGDVTVGSTIKLNENGSPVEYLVVHQGIPDASLYDSSCDGTWLLRKDIYEKRQWHSSTDNSYKASTIHAYLNNNFLNIFDNDVRDAIRQAKIPYVNGTGNSKVASGSSGLSTKVFLLSCYELGFTTSNDRYIPVDGAKLSYFEYNNRIAKYNGTATDWWTRSPNTVDEDRSWFVGRTGGYSSDFCSNSDDYGIRPALIMPSNLAVGSNGLVTGAMAETELRSVARKIKKGYIGIEGLARKIKKAYIGIGGVARPCWSGGELAYYGTVTAMNVERSELAATSVGDYALFGGGAGKYSAVYTTLDYYDGSLTHSTATGLANSRRLLAATTIGSYGLFAGGCNGAGTTYYDVVDAYNESLTRKTATALGLARYMLAGGSNSKYALFGGGFNSGTMVNTVDAYNTALTRSNVSGLSAPRRALAATFAGEYVLFGGGEDPDTLSNVDAYNTSLTRTTATELSEGRKDLAAIHIGGYALFAGGAYSTNVRDTVYAYDASLTRTTPTALSVARKLLSAISIGEYAIFAGGRTANAAVSGNKSAVVDVYDKSLTRTTTTNLSVQRDCLAAASVGNYALFGGGCDGSTYYSNVDAYTIA